MVGDETTQPGTSIDSNLWKEFRNDVRERRGRINGVLATELENAIRNYLDASHGGDVNDELRRLREDLDEVREAVVETPVEADGGTPAPSPSGDGAKEKNSQENPNRSRTSDADDGENGDDRDDDLLEDLDVGGDDRSTVEKRTDAAVAELVANYDQFKLDDLDDAIETGAGVASKPSLRKYRERVFDRLGGIDAVRHPAFDEKPVESSVFFVDGDEASALRAADLAKTTETTIEEAADEYGLPVDSVRDALAPPDLGAILVRDRGLDFEEAAREADVDADEIRDQLPADFVDDVDGGRDDRGDDDDGGDRELTNDESTETETDVEASFVDGEPVRPGDDPLDERAGVESTNREPLNAPSTADD